MDDSSVGNIQAPLSLLLSLINNRFLIIFGIFLEFMALS